MRIFDSRQIVWRPHHCNGPCWVERVGTRLWCTTCKRQGILEQPVHW